MVSIGQSEGNAEAGRSSKMKFDGVFFSHRGTGAVRRRESGGRRAVISRLLVAAGVIAIAACCSHFWFQLMLIQGDSMAPSYHNLQLTILDKRGASPERGEVIAFRCKALSAVLVKRVAAVPGDTVVIDGGTLYINGEISAFFPEKGAFDDAGMLSSPLKLRDGEYIVIGDNIVQSKDSRCPEIGIVREEHIIGKVI